MTLMVEHFKDKKVLVLVMLAVASVGSLLLIRSFAAVGDVVAFEAEQGTASGNVSVNSGDTTASGGNYATFNVTNPPAPQPTPTPPTPTPTPPPNPPSDPLATTCVAPTNFPPAPSGAMNYIKYSFGSSSLTSINVRLNLLNSLGSTNNHMYYQGYESQIAGKEFYFGIQGHGLLIFSVFGIGDTNRAVLGSGATVTSGQETGSSFLSVRLSIGDQLATGNYFVKLSRAAGDSDGDWYDYNVTLPSGTTRYVGSIKVPRNTTSASFMNAPGAAWTEFWDNNGNTLMPVPLTKLTTMIQEAKGANGQILKPTSAQLTYSPMPNADMKVLDTRTLEIQQVVGGNTSRCHTNGTVTATQ